MVAILVILAAVAVLTLVGLFVAVWQPYGPTSYLINSSFAPTSYQTAVEYKPRAPVSNRGIIIFPANLVDASQYSNLAITLVKQLRIPVLIAKPTLRIANFTPSTLALQRLAPGVSQWVYIGHSAGASSACRAATDAHAKPPLSIIAIAGYCTQQPVPITAILGSRDRLGSPAKHSSQASQTLLVSTNNHFFATNRAAHSQAYAQLVRDILSKIQAGDARQ